MTIDLDDLREHWKEGPLSLPSVNAWWERTVDDDGVITACSHHCDTAVVACRKDDVGNWYCPRCQRIYGARLPKERV